MGQYRQIYDDRTGILHDIVGIQDDTFTREGISADAKAVGKALAKKAEKDGYYKELTAGNAEQLISSVYVEDAVPYNFRTSGGSADIGARAVEKLIGGTIAWNQNYTHGSSATYDNIISGFNRSTGVLTLSGETNKTYFYISAGSIDDPNLINGHKYFVYIDNTLHMSYSIWANSVETEIATNKIGATIIAASVDGRFRCKATGYTSGTQISITTKPQVFDLTQMFGSTIADYIYGLEQSHAGDGVAWFRSLFPNPYYAYDAGSLRSVKALMKRSTGFNAFDSVTGKAKVLGGNVYQITGTYTALSLNGVAITPDLSGYFTPSETGELTVTGGNAADTCIHLKWDGDRDGEYEAYKVNEYPFDSDLELRGIPKLDSNNKLYYDGDVYESDGTVTRRYKTKTVFSRGTKDTTGKLYNIGGISDFGFTDNYVRAVCNKLPVVYLTDAMTKSDSGIKSVTLYGPSVYIGGFIGEESALDTFLQSLELVYELATPTTESAEPYQEIQIVDDFGTEEFVDGGVNASTPTRDVSIPVGHETKYQNNLVAKLEMAPESPPDGNGDYIVRQTNGTNEYVKLVIPDELPDNPTTDGNYVLKCTVSDGTATLTWEAQL